MTDDEDIFGEGSDLDEEVEVVEAFELQSPPPQISPDLLAASEGLLIQASERGDLLEERAPASSADDPFRHLGAGMVDDATDTQASEWVEKDAVAVGAAADELSSAIDLASELAGLIGEDSEATPATIGCPSASSSSTVAPKSVASSAAPAGDASEPAPTAASQCSDVLAVGTQIPGGPLGWTMTPKGYVFCDQQKHRGRITAWKSNVSVKCAAHGCGKARRGRTSPMGSLPIG